VAYEVARRLEQRPSAPRPEALFVSGRRAPTVPRADRLHLESDDRLVAELRRQGGTDPRLLDDKEILGMILPALRADYQAVETYTYRPGPPLAIPLTALVGDADPRATPAEAAAWGDHTTASFGLEVFSGGHFYLTEHQETLAALLRSRLTSRV
jgi:surfactin synthase thioesterase subunit